MLIGSVAVHSTDVQVIARVGRVKDTRWAGHNKGWVLAERVATFPVDAGMERERDMGGGGEGSRILCVCTCSSMILL